MPYRVNLYFEPSSKFKQTWSLVPQVRTLSVSGQKTSSLYSELSPLIPVFYILALLAIIFDVYLGFSILAKQGVNLGLIIGAVFFDLFFAIAPYIFESYIFKDWNHIKVENQIFKSKLECQTKRNNETDTEFEARRSGIIQGVLKKYESYRSNGKKLRTISTLIIFAIAGWKIYTFYNVLPPGVSIFSLVNGKIVIIFSLLCAIFHIIGSEKMIAHLSFWFIKGPELKQHQELHNGQRPVPNETEIEFIGEYKDAKSGNSRIINKNGKAYLEYIHVIWDDEIQSLINNQTDDNARRGIAIKCKENQLI